MFKETGLIIGNNWEQPKCPAVGEWENSGTRTRDPARQGQEINHTETYPRAEESPRRCALSERSQIQEVTTYHPIDMAGMYGELKNGPQDVHVPVPETTPHRRRDVHVKDVEMGDGQGGPVMESQGFEGTAERRCDNGSGGQRGERWEDAALWL